VPTEIIMQTKEEHQSALQRGGNSVNTTKRVRSGCCLASGQPRSHGSND